MCFFVVIIWFIVITKTIQKKPCMKVFYALLRLVLPFEESVIVLIPSIPFNKCYKSKIDYLKKIKKSNIYWRENKLFYWKLKTPIHFNVIYRCIPFQQL